MVYLLCPEHKDKHIFTEWRQQYTKCAFFINSQALASVFTLIIVHM